MQSYYVIVALNTSNFFFLLSSIQVEESIRFVQNFGFRFLMDLHVLGYPEHDLTIFGKFPVCLSCVCLCVCDKKLVATVTQKLMNRIS